jgi:hypothetical protein
MVLTIHITGKRANSLRMRSTRPLRARKMPANCTVYADSRFIGIFPKVDICNEKLEFKHEVSLEPAVTARREIEVKSVVLNLKAKEMEVFFIV